VRPNASNKRHFLIRLVIAISVLAICTAFQACSRTDQKPAGPPEKITIAYAVTLDAVLAEIAQAKDYFKQEGLEVTSHMHPFGKPALEDVLAGKADFATVAEIPVMFAIMKGEKISVIATIQSSNLNNAILASRDKGIVTLEDLKGKKIAVSLGTTSEFFLDSLLATHGMFRKDIQIVDLKADKMTDALAHGDVDAISTFTLYTALTQKKLGNRVITFRDKEINWYSFNVVATQDFIRKNPDKVKKVLRALVKAEEFARGNPAEAQKIMADFSGIEITIIREIWADDSIAVTLDQSLILALEDESRWAIKGGLTKARNVPNYLDFIYFDGLKSIKPDAVRILR
jgi:sulfonate transport system substrate-binding protein